MRRLFAASPGAVVFANPAHVELAPAPIPKDWIIEGDPQAHSKQLAASADRTSWVMAWSCTPGTFNWHYVVDEMVQIISGEVFVTDEKQRIRRLGPGDMAFFPAGSVSTWHVTHPLRKLAFCRHSMPLPVSFVFRAWKKLARIILGAGEDALLSSSTVRSASRPRWRINVAHRRNS